jgi:hypothetical protein
MSPLQYQGRLPTSRTLVSGRRKGGELTQKRRSASEELKANPITVKRGNDKVDRYRSRRTHRVWINNHLLALEVISTVCCLAGSLFVANTLPTEERSTQYSTEPCAYRPPWDGLRWWRHRAQAVGVVVEVSRRRQRSEAGACGRALSEHDPSHHHTPLRIVGVRRATRKLELLRPSQRAGSSPPFKLIEAHFRLPAVAGIQVITLFRLRCRWFWGKRGLLCWRGLRSRRGLLSR